LAKNVEIVRSVTENIKKYSPQAFIIVVTNPLDAIVYAAAKVSGFEHNKVMGMAGLWIVRVQLFLGVGAWRKYRAGAMRPDGGHGDDMVPLRDSHL